MQTMTVPEFKEAVRNEIFTVSFIKRTTGEVRRMNARFGVKKHLKGGSLSYDPAAHRLIGCFDVQKGEYRMINIETIRWLKAMGKVWGWDPKKSLFVEQDPGFTTD